MKMKNGMDIKDEIRCCPLGSLTLISRKIGKLFRPHFSALNVTNSQVYLFLMLEEEEEIQQVEIAKKLELDRSTVSRDLSRLLKNGYLYKSNGGNSPLIGLTKKGKELAAEIVTQWEKGYEDSVAVLGEKGMNALKELEQEIDKNLN